MTDLNIESQVRDILQRCTYSNDNCIKHKSLSEDTVKSDNDCAIRIIGNNNIIIEANFLYTTFLFILSCFWMYLCNR